MTNIVNNKKKTLGPVRTGDNLSEYMEMAAMYENMPKEQLEYMRVTGEQALACGGGKGVAGAFMQAVAAKTLNERFGTNYLAAEFGANGEYSLGLPDAKENPTRVDTKMKHRVPNIPGLTDLDLEETAAKDEAVEFGF